jgi:hypothetical protein
MLVFVIDSRNNIGHPTRRSGWIKKKLKNGTAKKIRRYGNLIQIQFLDRVFDKSKTVDCEFRFGIDPGYRNIGFCCYKIFKQKITRLFDGDLVTRTEEIKRLLIEKKMYRQNRKRNRRKNVIRKFGSVKFRHPRWKNRRDKLAWNPTLTHLINTHCNLLNKFTSLVNLEQTKIHFEYSKFDMHKALNPNVKTFWYQLGPQYRFKNVKSYVMARDKYTCQACNSKNIQDLTVHHLVETAKGGTNHPNNLVTVCLNCHHQKIHKGLLKVVFKLKMFRATGVLNSCTKKIFETFENVVPIQDVCGYITDVMRVFQDLPKTHSIDANIIATCDSLGYQEELSTYEFEDLENELKFVQKRRHIRNHVSRTEDRKYYVGKKLVANNRRKREGQKKDSLEDFRKKSLEKVTVKPGVKRPRISNTKVRFKPGDKVLYNNRICTCYGWGSTHGEVGLIEVGSYVKTRFCKVIAKNSGLVCLN